MRVAILQLTSSDDPGENLATVRDMLRDAQQEGAQIAMTPEVTNCVSMSRTHQAEVLQTEADNHFLRGLQAEAATLGLWVLAGSLSMKSAPPEPRFANRSLLIGANGAVQARYDKMHMFDVQVSEVETYRESDGYAPGEQAVLAQTPWARLGMTICYDLRFAYLYRALAQAGAEVLCVPSAFSPGTGPAHWQPLLQARAIETGCWVIAPAQTGRHPARRGRIRETWGHSLVISPWGDVVLDAGTDTGLHIIDIDLSKVTEARRKLPSLSHDRSFAGPL